MELKKLLQKFNIIQTKDKLCSKLQLPQLLQLFQFLMDFPSLHVLSLAHKLNVQNTPSKYFIAQRVFSLLITANWRIIIRDD